MENFETANGVEWLTWRRNFVVTAEINGWGDLRQRQEIRASMKGAAERAISDILHNPLPPPLVAGAIAAAPVVPLDAATLLDLYQARFLPAAETDLCRVALRHARQTEGENILEWHTRCRALYARAYPNRGADEIELQDQFKLGLYNKKIREATWEARPLTYTECLTAAHNKAASKAILEAHANPRGEVKQEPGLHAFGGGGYPERKPPGGSGSRGGCNYCGVEGHYKRECRKYTKALQDLDENAPAKKKGQGEGEKKKKWAGKGGKGKWAKKGEKAVNAVEQAEEGDDEGGETDQGNY